MKKRKILFSPKIGIEVEYFLIDSKGSLTPTAPSILADPRLQGIAVPESSHNCIEIHSAPLDNIVDLDLNLRANVKKVLDVATENGTLLVPTTTITKDKLEKISSPRYDISDAIFGMASETQNHIAGTHMHVDRAKNLAKQYALFYALDPSFVLLASSPFFFGQNSLVDHRAGIYRNGVFKDHPEYGQIFPPSKNPLMIYEQLHEQFVAMCEEKGLNPEGYNELNTYWGPIRFSKNTIENRSPDNNLISNIIGLSAVYMGLNRQLPTLDIPILSPADHEQMVNGNILMGLRAPATHQYLSHLVQLSKKGLTAEELVYLDPIEKILKDSRTFSDELCSYAKNQGLSAESRIAPLEAKQLRLYAADRLSRDLK
jgi:hypothetical protein